MLKLDLNQTAKILKGSYLYYLYRIGEYDTTKKYLFDYTESLSVYNFAKNIKTIHKEYLSVDWLFDYFNYQFTYWNFWLKNQKKQGNKNAMIYLHWIIGAKAVKRYNSRNKKDTYFYHSSFFPIYKITKEDYINFLFKKGYCLEVEEVEGEEEERVLQENPLSEMEERRKKWKFNTIEGFYNCIEYTSLFRFNSKICFQCNFKEQCRNLLKKRYPKIYQGRLAIKIKKQSLKEKNGKAVKK